MGSAHVDQTGNDLNILISPCNDTGPCSNVSPITDAIESSANVSSLQFGGPVINNDGDIIGSGPSSENINDPRPDVAVAEPAVQAKAQKKVTFADIVQGSAQKLSRIMKFGQFETVIHFKEDVPEIDPLRGTKYWNHELFQKLLRGDDVVVDGETRLAYEGPKRNAEGVFEVNIEGHFMKKSYTSDVFQLYGYFIGAVMPFRVVKENLIKMWHKYGLKSINMNRNGYFFFKFDHEDGMLQVLERNPWLVDNVPLVLQIWDPNVVLCKPNPKTVPIWVAIKDLPLSLWNGGNIGQIVSCVGLGNH
ncbi:hypothetical protein HanXRQr2_Chr09g0397381 [Helianthus annuus]|uniref:DUF4283 domain-containing protein n=1 Tax=Helianthus annuus TaxID=4232 RepID=A0A9K3I7G9_HELAN|nr:uncharacterized protein LOC118482158 [Helianthus annuus]KAF5791666.1 hypothetical protein HanXRQr2_Chr09g0397381 [Helianthus annuus]KAJ0893912.1 hypothetical protein HanPSC8_Chr09g0383141 [Helianthus annuus]